MEVTLEVNNQKYIEVLSLTLTAIENKKEINEEIIGQVVLGYGPLMYHGGQRMLPPIVINLKEGTQPMKN